MSQNDQSTMPSCASCFHGGEDHDWVSAPCSVLGAPIASTIRGVYPATWDDIRADHVVVAKEEGPFQSWWEAIVTQASGDTLTLRWRNQPQLPPLSRHRLHVALMLPKTS
jgi:hypothetical protein